jgi:hypothetical protein
MSGTDSKQSDSGAIKRVSLSNAEKIPPEGRTRELAPLLADGLMQGGKRVPDRPSSGGNSRDYSLPLFNSVTSVAKRNFTPLGWKLDRL